MNGYTDTRSDRERALDYAFRTIGFQYDLIDGTGPQGVDVDTLLLNAEKILLFIEGAAD